MTTGQIIRMIREARGMTQLELAIKAGYKTKSSITKIETGENDPSQRKLIMIARALEVNPSDLIPSDSDIVIPGETEEQFVQRKITQAVQSLPLSDCQQVLDYIAFLKSRGK